MNESDVAKTKYCPADPDQHWVIANPISVVQGVDHGKDWFGLILYGTTSSQRVTGEPTKSSPEGGPVVPQPPAWVYDLDEAPALIDRPGPFPANFPELVDQIASKVGAHLKGIMTNYARLVTAFSACCQQWQTELQGD